MDDVDGQIMTALRDDGRIGLSALSDRVGLSRPAVTRRLQMLLEEEDARVVGVVHPTVFGIQEIGHIALTVDGDGEEVGRTIASLDGVVFLTLTSGSMSMVAEVRARSRSGLLSTLQQVRALPGVVDTHTHVYTELYRDVMRSRVVPGARIDATDHELIQLLQRDGRASYSALARAVGIAPGTARVRVQRLLAEGIVQIGVLRRRSSHASAGVGVSVRGDVDVVARAILDLPSITFLAACIGRYDLLTTLQGTQTELIEALSRLRSIPGVLGTRSWTHLKVIKEQYQYRGDVV